MLSAVLHLAPRRARLRSDALRGVSEGLARMGAELVAKDVRGQVMASGSWVFMVPVGELLLMEAVGRMRLPRAVGSRLSVAVSLVVSHTSSLPLLTRLLRGLSAPSSSPADSAQERRAST